MAKTTPNRWRCEACQHMNGVTMTEAQGAAPRARAMTESQTERVTIGAPRPRESASEYFEQLYTDRAGVIGRELRESATHADFFSALFDDDNGFGLLH